MKRQRQTMFMVSSRTNCADFLCVECLNCVILSCKSSVGQSLLPSNASSAWWSFTNASDRHRIDGFVSRSVHCMRLLSTQPLIPPFEEQCKAAKRELCDQISQILAICCTLFSRHLHVLRQFRRHYNIYYY